MTNGAINITQLRKELKTSINSLAPLAARNARLKFESKKSKLLEDFRNHEVSQEIADGPDSASNILGYGNLFSLLGFYKNQKPISDLSKYLKKNINMDSIGDISIDGNLVLYSFNVSVPSEDELYDETPLPWDSSKSWLEEIEEGVSGFTNYIFKQYFKSPNPSRSSTGLQSKFNLRSTEVKGQKYLSDLIDSLVRSFS